ncbi:hypothetical protein PV326_007568 [Microctonus aethiopoides]|nr:hypothetical protein PV326_007568 [Microctonus aethiopoides]
MTLFPNSLKPKHHFLLHYSRVLHLCGPLWKISTIIFEAKHCEVNKTPEKITYDARSIKNVPLIYLNDYFEFAEVLPMSIKILKNINILASVEFVWECCVEHVTAESITALEMILSHMKQRFGTMSKVQERNRISGLACPADVKEKPMYWEMSGLRKV